MVRIWDTLVAIVAGVGGGLPFGLLMAWVMAPAPNGGQIPLMGMVAMVVRSDSLLIGWLYHLFNSIVIGGCFGLLVGGYVTSYRAGLSWGALYGFGWWILGGLTLMPLLLGMPVFAPVLMEPMRPVALASLVGHLMYGVILGVSFVWLSRQLSGEAIAHT
jgi:uncharacterized membrane protein YagU involved in acid resistance